MSGQNGRERNQCLQHLQNGLEVSFPHLEILVCPVGILEGSERIFLLCSPCLFTALCVWDQDRQGSSTASLGQSPLALAVVLLRVPRRMATVIQNTPPGLRLSNLREE